MRAFLFLSSAIAGLAAAESAWAQSAATASDAGGANGSELVVTATRTTRSAVALNGTEMQKLLPGVSPLKAIETLPGVIYETADPWGNNEQNEALFVHGFSTQQLGYTMDRVPLGDQQYGNYNGLSPSRAISSENVDHVTLESGAGSLGVASTSNLGGAIETFSVDPAQTRGADVRQTFGSYDAFRTFVRVNTGDFGPDGESRLYVSYLHYDAQAWDFDGHQKGDQVNLKYVHEDARGKLTLFGDWQSKVEPNEDAVAFGSQQAATSTYFPYTRPFIYPNYSAALAYLTNGTPPAALGNNFSNYFSAAQRMDVLTYARYDYTVANNVTWSVQPYYHYDYGRGIVAGPINQAGLPSLFAAYFPSLVVGGSPTSAGSLANLVNLFGGTGYEVRTTEYKIDREGVLSNLDATLGDHSLEAGIWYEHNHSTQRRVWYPFSEANDDLTPYDIPRNPSVLVQYYGVFDTDDVQLHLQDQWRVLPNLLLQAGWKASLQTATGDFPINQVNLPTANPPVQYPSGTINSNNWLLPQAGALWDVTKTEQVFVNVQKNMHQFIPYGAGGNFFGYSPWSLGTQAAFDLFKTTVHPETSWTYEGGIRTHHTLDLGVITGIDGQAEFYHVNFYNRILNVAPYNFINPAPVILVNVGGVTTNGVDVAATLHFGPHFELYDAFTWNKSTYDDNYNSGIGSGGVATVVPTAGKFVPLMPEFMDRFIASANWGPFGAQLSGDYIGRRFVTYLNDLSVPSTVVLGAQASYTFEVPQADWIKRARVSLNVTNLNDEKGVSTAVVTSASGGYQAYPLPPRMVFGTIEASF